MAGCSYGTARNGGRWAIGYSGLIGDTVVFVLEKLVAAGPINTIVVRLPPGRSAIAAYLVAAAHESLERPVPEGARQIRSARWSGRMLRFAASDARRAGDFPASKRLALDAAAGETYAPFLSEYILSAGASAFEAGAFTEAYSLFDEALRVWRSSHLARLLEPRLESVAHYLKWACLNELGTPKEGLVFLHAAASTQRNRTQRREQWLQLLREAYNAGDTGYARLGLEGATRYCSHDDEELQYWKGQLSG
jgi:hypothetical protein